MVREYSPDCPNWIRIELDFKPESSFKSEEKEFIDLFVCGSHMSELPLNHQLIELGAEFLCTTETAPHYRMFLLPKTESLPIRPGLVRCLEETVSLPGELWRIPLKNFGAFMLKIRFPLGISQVQLKSGDMKYGFCCDPSGVQKLYRDNEFKENLAFTSSRIAY